MTAIVFLCVPRYVETVPCGTRGTCLQKLADQEYCFLPLVFFFLPFCQCHECEKSFLWPEETFISSPLKVEKWFGEFAKTMSSSRFES